MANDLFDLSAHYEEMLEQGLKVSGESQRYFLAGRIQDLRGRLPPDFSPGAILDYGCGIGLGSGALAEAFPGARVTGVDTSRDALARAEKEHASARVAFRPLEELAGLGSFDLCYCNGVFHHILPERRPAAARALRDALRPGGFLGFFENNPWNPGARLVMRRIPFDRDARMISAPAARRLLEGAGFGGFSTRFLFYFPRPLAFFRFAEPALARLPGGAQYGVLAARA